MKKIMSIFGTRPEAIKMCPLVLEIERTEGLQNVVVVTAQHREMLDQVLEVFDIKPDYDLNIMKKGQTLNSITVSVLENLDEVIKREHPDMILVHGDTTTTFAGALAAFYNKVPVGHVEAGLRTYDKYSPYPEEMNRVLTTRLSDLNFAPTEISKQNLLKENVPAESIFITGNTVIDALQTTVKEGYHFSNALLNTLDRTKKIITMTAHRRENLGEPLEQICEAVKEIAEVREDVLFVYAVHLNPAVRDTAERILSPVKNVLLVEPLELMDMHNLLNISYMVLTDSGGLQEEVPSLGKPVLVLRDVTERPEGLAAGTLKLVGTDKRKIIQESIRLLDDAEEYQRMARAVNPYGDGTASKQIVSVIRGLK